MAITDFHIFGTSATRQVLRRYVSAIAVGNLAWEAAHLPLFTLWQTSSAGYLAFVVLHCWVGDLLIAAVALSVSLLVCGRAWPLHNYARVAAITVLTGAVYTVFSEWLNVEVRRSWAYATAMPRVPPLGTGLSPLLQWIIVPLASFAWAKPPGPAR
jgi:hypothetical protein